MVESQCRLRPWKKPLKDLLGADRIIDKKIAISQQIGARQSVAICLSALGCEFRPPLTIKTQALG
jgi:hypothetical protein